MFPSSKATVRQQGGPGGNVEDDLDKRLNSWPRLSPLPAPLGLSSSKSSSPAWLQDHRDTARQQSGSTAEAAAAAVAAGRREPSTYPAPIAEGIEPPSPSRAIGVRASPLAIRSLRLRYDASNAAGGRGRRPENAEIEGRSRAGGGSI